MPANSAKPKRQTMEAALGIKEAQGFMGLLNDTTTPGQPTVGARDLPLDVIDPNPYQARQAFNAGGLQELAESIREHGVLEPILVRPVGARYEIVAGERRYRASVIAGQNTIAARIMELDNQQAAIITALENLQREDLDIEDEGRQFAYLLEATGLSQRKLADKLGINHNYLSRRVRLLKRPDLLETYRSGRKKLHEVLTMLDETSETTSAEESVSLGHSNDETLSYEFDKETEFELIEREDMPGYIVSRGHSHVEQSDGQGSGTDKGGGRFRWRPLQQFHNWVGRTHIRDIPPDERATVRVQLTEIKDALEKQLRELDEIENC